MNNDTPPLTANQPVLPTPTVVNLGSGTDNQVRLPGRNWFDPKMFFALGGFLVLLVGIVVGTFLVQRSQTQNPQSKAAGTCAPIGWLENPGPANGATNVSTTPDFSWTFERGLWGQNGDWINLYVWRCPEMIGSCQSIFHTKFETSGPVYSISWSEAGKVDPLDCNTTYYWQAYVSDACIGPMVPNATWHFTTGCPPQQSVTCDSLTLNPAAGNPPLSTTATLAGHTTNGGSVVSYKFDFGDGSAPVIQSTGTLAHSYTTAGTFTVKGTVADDKGNTDGGTGNCQTSVTVTQQGTAACQMVSADKDLASVKIGDVVTFTGWGITSDDIEKIDQINFIISTPSGTLSDTTVAATRDTTKDTSFGGKAWKGVQIFTVPGSGNYSVKIRAHWVSKNQWLE